MDERRMWPTIDGLRRATVDMLSDLSADEWDQQSLCTEWTVKDVAAHLTMAGMGAGELVALMVRNLSGGTNAMIAKGSRSIARASTTDQLVDRIERSIGFHRPMIGPGLTVHEMLLDTIAHGQDIAVPLGRSLPVPLEAAAASADRVISYGGRGNAKVFRHVPLDGLRLVATDHAWSRGQGEPVRGGMLDLFLLVAGRTQVLTRLAGDGSALLSART